MLQDHLDKCPFQEVECEFSHVGCKDKVGCCDLAQHLSDNGIHHSALSSKMICENLQIWWKRNTDNYKRDRQLQEKEGQIAIKEKKYDEQKSMIEQLQEKDKKLDELSKKLECLECVVTDIHGIVQFW